MITLKPFKKANLRLLISEEARRINNYKDCDVIQNALEKVENATTDDETLEAINYLIVAVDYRGGEKFIVDIHSSIVVDAQNEEEAVSRANELVKDANPISADIANEILVNAIIDDETVTIL